MNCIPFLNWKEKYNRKTEFKDFNLQAEAHIKESLKMKLDQLPIKDRSKNLLVLELNKDIKSVKEEYKLLIREGLIEVSSPCLAGLSHGLSTIKLLLYTGENCLQEGLIEEAPKFENRGVFLDVSRGKLPTISYLKDLISFLSHMKYNILQLYSEDKLQIKSDPDIGVLTGAYGEDEIRELDSWCKAHFIELQPCLQTYSHLHGILRLPAYEDLAENENLFSMAAGKEEVYEFFDRTFKEVLPWFSSKVININMDEAYDLGSGYSKEAVLKDGKGLVYLKHIKRIYSLAKKHGAEKIIIWGDIALKYQELLDMLPEDIIVADWNYNPLKEFKTLDSLEKSKVDFWAGGGVSSWNSLFPRVYNSYINLRYYSTEALKKGAKGFLVTDWGDYGHAQSLGLSLYGYMIGAEQSYNAKLTAVKDLEESIFPLIFKDQRVEKAFKLLMDSNLAPNLQTDFKTMSIYYFFDDFFDGLAMNGNERYPKLNIDTFNVLDRTGREAYKLLKDLMEENKNYGEDFPDETWQSLFGQTFIMELLLAARATKYTGRKGILSLEIKESFKSGGVTPKEILAYILEIKQLYTEFLFIRRKFEDTWSKRAYSDSIQSNLLIFDKAGIQMGEAVTWLSDQYRRLKRDGEIDKNMESYTAGKDYHILWTTDYKKMWERAYPWQ